MRRALRHPTAPTARKPPAPFTRKRHQVLAPAARALKPHDAALEHAAQQEFPELALDELRRPTPSPASVVAFRKVSRCSLITWWSTVCSASRGRYRGTTHPMPRGSTSAPTCPYPKIDTSVPRPGPPCPVRLLQWRTLGRMHAISAQKGRPGLFLESLATGILGRHRARREALRTAQEDLFVPAPRNFLFTPVLPVEAFTGGYPEVAGGTVATTRLQVNPATRFSRGLGIGANSGFRMRPRRVGPADPRARHGARGAPS